MIDVVGILEIPSVTCSNDARFPAWQNFLYYCSQRFEWLFLSSTNFRKSNYANWKTMCWLLRLYRISKLGKIICLKYESFLIIVQRIKVFKVRMYMRTLLNVCSLTNLETLKMWIFIQKPFKSETYAETRPNSIKIVIHSTSPNLIFLSYFRIQLLVQKS